MKLLSAAPLQHAKIFALNLTEFAQDHAMAASSTLILLAEMMREESAATLEMIAAKWYTMSRPSTDVNHATQLVKSSTSTQRFAQQSKTSTNGHVIRTHTPSWPLLAL